jgi:hypothetical protein
MTVEREVSVKTEHVRKAPAAGSVGLLPADKLKSRSGKWEEVVDFVWSEGHEMITFKLADGSTRRKQWGALITVKRRVRRLGKVLSWLTSA